MYGQACNNLQVFCVAGKTSFEVHQVPDHKNPNLKVQADTKENYASSPAWKHTQPRQQVTLPVGRYQGKIRDRGAGSRAGAIDGS